jgi:hypothetical protein
MSEPTWELLGGGGVIGGPIDYVGDWAAGTTYQPGQVVRFAGVDYLAVNPSTGQVPPRASSPPVGMVCLYDSILAAPGSFDVPNIPQDYAGLVIKASVRSTGVVTNDQLQVRFNGDSGANYAYQFLRAAAAVASGAEGLGQSALWMGQPAAANAPANAFDTQMLEIMDYASAIKHKSTFAMFTTRSTDATAGLQMGAVAGFWKNIAAINRIQVFANAALAAGSRLTIYGVLSVGQAPPVTTLSPGGIGTSFPVSPTNGELFTLVDSLTAPTYAWECRYVASITDAYKWLCVGDGVKGARAETDYPANAALTLSVPRPGIYHLENGAMGYAAVADTIYSCDLTVDGAGSYAYTTFRAVNSAGSMFPIFAHHLNVPVAALITQRSNVAGGSRIERRSITAVPVRLS